MSSSQVKWPPHPSWEPQQGFRFYFKAENLYGLPGRELQDYLKFKLAEMGVVSPSNVEVTVNMIAEHATGGVVFPSFAVAERVFALHHDTEFKPQGFKSPILLRLRWTNKATQLRSNLPIFRLKPLGPCITAVSIFDAYRIFGPIHRCRVIEEKVTNESLPPILVGELEFHDVSSYSNYEHAVIKQAKTLHIDYCGILIDLPRELAPPSVRSLPREVDILGRLDATMLGPSESRVLESCFKHFSQYGYVLPTKMIGSHAALGSMEPPRRLLIRFGTIHEAMRAYGTIPLDFGNVSANPYTINSSPSFQCKETTRSWDARPKPALFQSEPVTAEDMIIVKGEAIDEGIDISAPPTVHEDGPKTKKTYGNSNPSLSTLPPTVSTGPPKLDPVFPPAHLAPPSAIFANSTTTGTNADQEIIPYTDLADIPGKRIMLSNHTGAPSGSASGKHGDRRGSEAKGRKGGSSFRGPTTREHVWEEGDPIAPSGYYLVELDADPESVERRGNIIRKYFGESLPSLSDMMSYTKEDLAKIREQKWQKDQADLVRTTRKYQLAEILELETQWALSGPGPKNKEEALQQQRELFDLQSPLLSRWDQDGAMMKLLAMREREAEKRPLNGKHLMQAVKLGMKRYKEGEEVRKPPLQKAGSSSAGAPRQSAASSSKALAFTTIEALPWEFQHFLQWEDSHDKADIIDFLLVRDGDRFAHSELITLFTEKNWKPTIEKWVNEPLFTRWSEQMQKRK